MKCILVLRFMMLVGFIVVIIWKWNRLMGFLMSWKFIMVVCCVLLIV